MKRYKDFPEYFKTRFGERVQKLSIDGGFTCPNRDGKISKGGCTFCNNESFSPDYCRKVNGIYKQIEAGIDFFDNKYKGQKYLAYFQAYSNTYAEIEILKQKYEEALSHPKVIGIVIGTRPDIVSEDLLEYLEELAKEYYVSIEYGVESANDEILTSINRGHDFKTAEEAIIKTANRGIVIGAHLIFGLPGESEESMMEGALKLCSLPIDVLKLHQLQIIKGTEMARQYNENPKNFKLYKMEDYLNFVVELISKMPNDIYLERFVNQSPGEYLIAPKWGVKNYEFTAKLDKKLEELNIYQSCYRNI